MNVLYAFVPTYLECTGCTVYLRQNAYSTVLGLAVSFAVGDGVLADIIHTLSLQSNQIAVKQRMRVLFVWRQTILYRDRSYLGERDISYVGNGGEI
jgi:hypothetical protein